MTTEDKGEGCTLPNVECPEHGFVHGCEASELRVGIEKILEAFDETGLDPNGHVSLSDAEEMVGQLAAMYESLEDLLKQVDAHDSLAFEEAAAAQHVRERSKYESGAKYGHEPTKTKMPIDIPEVVRVLFVPADPNKPVNVQYITPTSEGLQAAIGGRFKRVCLTTNTNVVGEIRQNALYVSVDDMETAASRGSLPVNERLTRRLRLYFDSLRGRRAGQRLLPDLIVGDGVIVAEDDAEEGDGTPFEHRRNNMTDLSDAEWAHWETQLCYVVGSEKRQEEDKWQR